MTFAFGMVSVRVCVTLAALTMALGAAATTARASVVTEFTVPTAASQPRGIAAGPDGALWFTENNTNKIGRITLDVGPAGPAGTAGTQGTAGTPGKQGTPGQPGTAGSDRFILAAAFGQDPYRARRGRSLTVRYVSTLAADVTVEIRKGSRVIKRQLARARAGRNKLTIRNLPRGRFTLRLRAFITGQTSTDTARLTVTR